MDEATLRQDSLAKNCVLIARPHRLLWRALAKNVSDDLLPHIQSAGCGLGG